MAHDAARWPFDGGKGSKAAVKSGLFGDPETMTRNMIAPARTPTSLHATRKRSVDLALTPQGIVSGSLESEKAKVQCLVAYAQELEAATEAAAEAHRQELEARFDPMAAGLLVPDVVVWPDKAGPNGRKRLTAMHGSVAVRGVACWG